MKVIQSSCNPLSCSSLCLFWFSNSVAFLNGNSVLSGGQATLWKRLPLFKSLETLDPEFIWEDNWIFDYFLLSITSPLTSDFQIESFSMLIISQKTHGQIFLLEPGGDQNQRWKRVNNGFIFTRWPETHLQRNINVTLCCQAMTVPPVGYRFAISRTPPKSAISCLFQGIICQDNV